MLHRTRCMFLAKVYVLLYFMENLLQEICGNIKLIYAYNAGFLIY